MSVSEPVVRQIRVLPEALDLAPLASTLWRRRRRFAWFDSALQRPEQGEVSVLCETTRTAFALGRSCRREDAAFSCVSSLRARFDAGARRHDHAPGDGDFGFTGGWVGYLAYEAQIDFDPAFPGRDGLLPYPRVWFLEATRGVTVRHAENRTVIWEWVQPGSQSSWLDFVGNTLEESAAETEPAGDAWLADPPVDSTWHSDSVRTILRLIGRGDIFQANLTAPVEMTGSPDPYRLYRHLRSETAGDYAAFLSWPGLTVCSTSPELFFRVDGRTVSARPMKGTRPRGGEDEEDRGNRTALAESAKDRAENLMIVDLLRNDLGRVAEIGSVVVPALFSVEEYSTVFQMTSTIEASLGPGQDVFSLFGALFPPGSMTGAPKIQATRVIRSLEPEPRGLYSGCVGFIDWRGDARFNVVIRTLVKDQRCMSWGVGGGIVADSTPESEYAEALQKLEGLSRAISR